jgi:hypothetical protein
MFGKVIRLTSSEGGYAFTTDDGIVYTIIAVVEDFFRKIRIEAIVSLYD